MCYAIPAKLVSIDGHTATVDYFGEQRQILLDLDDVEIGFEGRSWAYVSIIDNRTNDPTTLW